MIKQLLNFCEVNISQFLQEKDAKLGIYFLSTIVMIFARARELIARAPKNTLPGVSLF